MDRMERLLYDASLEGNVTILLMLLQEDPLFLDKATLSRVDDMPLHVASMLGHIDFVREILKRKPGLCLECDSKRRLPLHLASSKGHAEVVRALISVNSEMCGARDRDGRNALHVAAIKGQIEVVKELVKAQPHVARAMVQQDTILHLCVKCNQLEVLKVLVEAMGDHEFVNTKDADGNTILHLAVADKQIEIINFLLLDTTIEVNAANTNGETPLNILYQGPRDMNDQHILGSLERAGAVGVNKDSTVFGQIPRNYKRNMVSKIFKRNRDTYHSNNKEEWFERTRGTLIIVASLLATMAFQAGTSPPDNMTKNTKNYHIFLVSNTLGFVSTLSVILLLISGLRIVKHRPVFWTMVFIMWIAIASMTVSYLCSLWAWKPKDDKTLPKNYDKTFQIIVSVTALVWIGIVSLIVMGYAKQLEKDLAKK